MSAALSQILDLVGRLDDAPGLGTGRERFRRYLVEHVTSLDGLEPLIAEAERALGEQPRRALQDALVVLGRFLGFETMFGVYHRPPGAVQYDGAWISRRRLQVVIEIADEMWAYTGGDASRLIATLTSQGSIDTATPLVALSISTPVSVARGHRLRAGSNVSDRRTVSTRSLIWLARMVTAGRISHEEIVRLFTSAAALDFVVALLQRFGGESAEPPDEVSPPAAAAPLASEPDYWAAIAGPDEAARFDAILDGAAERVLEVAEDQAVSAIPCEGDWICFVAPGRGVMGRAQIERLIEPEPGTNRSRTHPVRAYRLNAVERRDGTAPPDPEIERAIAVRSERSGAPGPLLVPIARQKFEWLVFGSGGEPPTVTAQGSRSGA